MYCLDKKREKEVKNTLPQLIILLIFIFSLIILSGFVTAQNADSPLENSQRRIWFDVKIIDFESPMELGEFFDFTYLVKGMGEINKDIEMNFWIEKDGRIISSGSDTIYLGNFEEKTETTKIFLPKNMESGVYDFVVEVVYENYKIKSHRTIEIEIKKGIAKITTAEGKILNIYVISGLVGLAIFILSLIFYLERRKIKKQFLQGEKWIKKYKIFILTLLLFITLGTLTYYLNILEGIVKGILKLIFSLKINIIPYFGTSSFYYTFGTILILVALIFLIIVAKKKRWFKKLEHWRKEKKIKKVSRKKVFEKKHKQTVKQSKIKFKKISKSQNKILKKLGLFLKIINPLKLLKSFVGFIKKNIILLIGLRKKHRRKEKKKTKLIKKLHKKRKREEFIKKRKKRGEETIRKRKQKKEELRKRKREKKRTREKIQNLFRKTSIQIKKTAQFLVEKREKRKNILKEIKKSRKEKREKHLEKKKELKRKKKIIKKRKQFFKKKRKKILKEIKKNKREKKQKYLEKKKALSRKDKRLKKRKRKKIKKNIEFPNLFKEYEIKKIPKIDFKKMINKFPKIKFPKRHLPKPIIKPGKNLRNVIKLNVPNPLKVRKVLAQKITNKIEKFAKNLKNKFKIPKWSILKKEKYIIGKGEKAILKKIGKEINQIHKHIFKPLNKIFGKKSREEILKNFETTLIKTGKFTQQHLEALEDVIDTKTKFKKKQLHIEFKRNKLNFQNKINKTKRNAAVLINELTKYLNDLISLKKRKKIKTKKIKKRAEGNKLTKDFFSKEITQEHIGKIAKQLTKEIENKKKRINLAKVGNKLKKGINRTFARIFDYSKSSVLENISRIKNQLKQKPRLKKKPEEKQFQERKTTTQLIKDIDAEQEAKKQEKTKLFKEKLYKKSEKTQPTKVKTFDKRPQEKTESNEDALDEMFEEKPQQTPKEKPIEQSQEKTKEELDEILDQIEKKEEKSEEQKQKPTETKPENVEAREKGAKEKEKKEEKAEE